LGGRSSRGNPRVVVRLQRRLLMLLDMVATQKGKTRSAVIREAILEYLSREAEKHLGGRV
jgi:metal-responsive CopG/Arc/MetJ family transcriptional regulator